VGSKIQQITILLGCALFRRRFAASCVTFSIPGASVTWGADINNNGDVAGGYIVSLGTGGPSHAFVRTSDGAITLF
jgi:hypothetical protein